MDASNIGITSFVWPINLSHAKSSGQIGTFPHRKYTDLATVHF